MERRIGSARQDLQEGGPGWQRNALVTMDLVAGCDHMCRCVLCAERRHAASATPDRPFVLISNRRRVL